MIYQITKKTHSGLYQICNIQYGYFCISAK